MFFTIFITAAGDDQIRADFAWKQTPKGFSSLLQFRESIEYPNRDRGETPNEERFSLELTKGEKGENCQALTAFTLDIPAEVGPVPVRLSRKTKHGEGRPGRGCRWMRGQPGRLPLPFWVYQLLSRSLHPLPFSVGSKNWVWSVRSGDWGRAIYPFLPVPNPEKWGGWTSFWHWLSQRTKRLFEGKSRDTAPTRVTWFEIISILMPVEDFCFLALTSPLSHWEMTQYLPPSGHMTSSWPVIELHPPVPSD